MRGKQRKKQSTNEMAAEWAEAIKRLRPLFLKAAEETMTTFLQVPGAMTAHIEGLAASLNPQRYRADQEAAARAHEAGDALAVLRLSYSFGDDLNKLDVSRTMRADVEQAIVRVNSGEQDLAEAVRSLSTRRAALLETFLPAIRHAMIKFGEGNDEKACRSLTAYIGFPAQVEERLKYALKREASATSGHAAQESRRDQLFSELAPAVAVLRQQGNAPLSPTNLDAMREQAIEDVRSFDPTRPQQGFAPIIDEGLADPGTDADAIERLRESNEAYQKRVQDFFPSLSPQQVQLVEATRAGVEQGRKFTDQEIAEKLNVAAPVVANQRRRMLKKWDPVLYENTRRKKSA